MSVTYDQIVSKARELRKLIMKLASYDLVKQLLESISVTTPLSGKLFESPTSLRYNSGLTNHVDAPIPKFVIKDASGNVYTDIGVESPTGAPVSVVPDDFHEEYIKRRLAYQARKKLPYAYVKVGDKFAVMKSSVISRIASIINILKDNVQVFNYPADQTPKVTDEGYYQLFVSATYVDFTDVVFGDALNVRVTLFLCDFLAYINEKGQYVGSDGIYIEVSNDESVDAEVMIPNIVDVTVSATSFMMFAYATNFVLVARTTTSTT